MRQVVADYWWGREDCKRKVHWRSWEWLSTPKSLGGLGFRDFSLFNQAMLGKQSWRLLTEPDSLCARVLKGRYFPHCDFWDAPKPRSSSYTWRSILFGQELVKAGIRWGIANGQKVNIMTYPWIPERPPHLLQTLSPIPDNAKVCCLMDGHDHWNEENVRAFFSEETAQPILQTQISRHAGDDFVYWPHTRFGLYTVRSAYNLARSLDFFSTQSMAGRGLPSNLEIEEKYWKAIWAIKAPKVDIFHLPLSPEAFIQYQQLQETIQNLNVIQQENDVWTFKWGDKYSSRKYYKFVHRLIDPQLLSLGYGNPNYGQS
jgi:hypothetical protein